jgi:hypothetical protein
MVLAAHALSRRTHCRVLVSDGRSSAVLFGVVLLGGSDHPGVRASPRCWVGAGIVLVNR